MPADGAAEQVTFGRRRGPAPAPPRVAARSEPPSPELEAFAASIRAAGASDVDQFARWRRDRFPRTLLMVALRFALLTPGLIGFAVQAPWWLSLSLEGAGLAANVWLRRERRRQASAIAAWTPDG